ncbi:hypothetical protein B0H14DRAFT_2634904 [Mycena olivaceomarginata]|nr:hypothetical protein B0H14DRAFT_2634904 [Mycena olivaceomarginata]
MSPSQDYLSRFGWDLERETQESRSVWISDLECEFDSLGFEIEILDDKEASQKRKRKACSAGAHPRSVERRQILIPVGTPFDSGMGRSTGWYFFPGVPEPESELDLGGTWNGGRESLWISDLAYAENVHRCLDETKVSVASEKKRKEKKTYSAGSGSGRASARHSTLKGKHTKSTRPRCILRASADVDDNRGRRQERTTLYVPDSESIVVVVGQNVLLVEENHGFFGQQVVLYKLPAACLEGQRGIE